MDKRIEDLDLGRFKDCINKSLLKLNEDGTFDYDGVLNLENIKMKSFLEIPIKLRKVTKTLWCNKNGLISLEGAPLEIGESFSCSFNNLISLQYAPRKIVGNFFCRYNHLFSKYHLSNIDREFLIGYNSFSITNEAIKTIKEMTIDQRVSELKFFKENDLDAYEMMIQIMNENDLGYGPKAKEMLAHTNKFDISNLV